MRFIVEKRNFLVLVNDQISIKIGWMEYFLFSWLFCLSVFGCVARMIILIEWLVFMGTFYFYDLTCIGQPALKFVIDIGGIEKEIKAKRRKTRRVQRKVGALGNVL